MKGGDDPELSIPNLYDTVHNKLIESEIANKEQLINKLKEIYDSNIENKLEKLNEFNSGIDKLMDQSKNTGEATQPVEAQVEEGGRRRRRRRGRKSRKSRKSRKIRRKSRKARKARKSRKTKRRRRRRRRR